MYKIICTNKKTRETIVYGTCATEEQATHICEAWGWIYDDGKDSFWMSVGQEEA